MKSSLEWIDYFRQNLEKKRIDWTIQPQLADPERRNIVKSMQAWQLGETSEGMQLKAAAKKYANRIGDDFYCEAIDLFIKEEQKHGNNLGRYLDLIGEKRIKKDWGDSLFRKIRHLNTSMEMWTITVIIVESAAQVYYQALKDATKCTLLKQICTDILIDEAAHIDFQVQRLAIIFSGKTVLQRIICCQLYQLFYFSTALVVWVAHRKLFKAGNISLSKYFRKMNVKFKKAVHRLYNGKTFSDMPILTINHPV